MKNLQRPISYYEKLNPQSFLNEILIKKNMPYQELISILDKMFKNTNKIEYMKLRTKEPFENDEIFKDFSNELKYFIRIKLINYEIVKHLSLKAQSSITSLYKKEFEYHPIH